MVSFPHHTFRCPEKRDQIRSAGESMHYHKLLESRSAHNSILSSMMATMLARSRETEAHGERMASLSRRMGESLNLKQKALDELELYAILHDIGKVGVDDSILNKPGKLDAGEWELMKKVTIFFFMIMPIIQLEHR